MLSARKFCWIFALWSCALLAGGWPSSALSESTVTIDTQPGKPILLEINKLAKLRSSEIVKRAHVVNPAIAEIIISETQSPEWVFVSGKAIGTTQLTLWGNENNEIGTFEVVVRPNVTGLKKHIHDIFPQEHVLISDSGEFISLSGTISGATKMQKILALAEAYAPGKIINLLQVGGIQQVMLEVRIAEISKSVGNQLGVNFSQSGQHGFGVSLLNGLTSGGLPSVNNVTDITTYQSGLNSTRTSTNTTTGPFAIGPRTTFGSQTSTDSINTTIDTADSVVQSGIFTSPNLPLLSPAVNAALGFFNGNDSFIIAVDALQEDGLLKILAKPTLIAQSGQSASFLAGGEFPYPTVQDGDVEIEWKPFGVGLNFTPTVLGDGKISLLVSPEVSELDFTKTIAVSGYVMPALDTRRMSTVVELGDNQSFAIAGLLKNYVRESVAKFPLLGDIPILGALFRSTKYQKDETELVVIVTPHLVKPVDGDQLSLPTDSFIEPSAFEILLLGMMEGEGKKTADSGAVPVMDATAPVQPSLEGDFGHIVPE